MLGELGTASLAAGMLSATLTALLWLRTALFGGPTRPARITTTLTLLAAVAACAVLEAALLRHDFSVRFVAENGGHGVPVYYTVTSLWSALDGSLLLWLLIHGGYATALARRPGRYPSRLHGYAMVVVSAVGMFFFALAYFAANPFRTVQPVPVSGPGPNPLLQQHPAMGLHPPLLYAGYIGLVVPFAFALAALLAGRAGRGWLSAARPWALFAWVTLTAGIGLGAWWSYAVLGWGGYWAWDPVENASLLPWLTATAFLHTTLPAGRPGTRATWNVLLACASFVLVLLGTFLTRSGAVASVHAFTASPLGPMLLGFVLLAVTVSTVLSGWRAPPPAAGPPAPLLSRSTAVLVNGVLLLTITAMVLVGTIFPLLSESLGGTRTAVGPAYYHRTAVPLAVVLLVVMGATPALRGSPRRLAVPAGAALATVAVVGLANRPGLPALTAFAAGAFVLAGVAGQATDRLRRPARASRRARLAGFAGLAAHAGIAVVALGVAGTSAYSASAERELRVGEAVTVGDVSVRLVEVHRQAGADGMAVSARLRLTEPRDRDRILAPDLRYYPARDTAVTVPRIETGLLRDTYVTLIAVAPDNSGATVRLAVNPLVGLLWAGGALTVAGGLLALLTSVRQRRTGNSRPPEVRPAVGAATVAQART
ncbi:cytochrome c-type biogenesis protein CcmF [Micromonospora rhizosphaerae]|uniref:Cytochrome c-type biogenesis protein CcmF n=1 Tax=Micromonospora rhizosphaerae TaxID=568872 RepID=A0A1C6STN4_9ACTN|nr:cytochrome c-type biogenesis CcmF C-terminal domain-containing protein [Micromonospora rhizosphaerae]SCL32880.1 cytochrome c-type biogenesis protein CcmF [Micromonospora rhizosphaerae]